jgi:hypothetical protein
MAIHGATFWIGACRQSLLASSLTLSHLVQRLNCARCTRYIDAPPHETTAGLARLQFRTYWDMSCKASPDIIYANCILKCEGIWILPIAGSSISCSFSS